MTHIASRCGPSLGTIAFRDHSAGLIFSLHVMQVLRHQFPHAPLHDDVRTLRLTEACTLTSRIDVVLVSTSCVDVSTRGARKAQDGMVRILTATVACGRLYPQLSPGNALCAGIQLVL